jgi:hypothetical protein
LALLLLIIILGLYGPLLGLGRFFSFLILYAVGRTPWTGDQPVVRPLPTHRTKQTPNKRTQTSMPLVRFELTIPAFERAKTLYALDRAAAVIGWLYLYHTFITLQTDISPYKSFTWNVVQVYLVLRLLYMHVCIPHTRFSLRNASSYEGFRIYTF